jgi:hypothetical protein
MFVAITTNLTNSVSRKIRNLRQTEAGAEPAMPTIELDGTEPWGAHSLWGPVYDGISDELRAALTCKETKQLNFLIATPGGADEDGRQEPTINFTAMSPGVPRLFYVDEDGDKNYDTPKVHVTQDMHPVFAAYVANITSRNEISRRWSKVENDIVGFLKASKSLNEALKLWPDIARYIDAEVLAKVNEKTVTKAKPAQSEAMKKLAAMDLDAITSSTVLVRLINSGDNP